MFENLLDPEFDISKIVKRNEINDKTKSAKEDIVIKGNTVQKETVVVANVTASPIDAHNISTDPVKDIKIGGRIDSVYSSGDKLYPIDNDDTDWENSDLSEVFGSGDNGIQEDIAVSKQLGNGKSEISWDIKMALKSVLSRQGGKRRSDKVHVGKLYREPFARDDRYSQYPKDRGKYISKYDKTKMPNPTTFFPHYNSKQHSIVSRQCLIKKE